MPIIKSAIKKVRKDKNRLKQNDKYRQGLASTLKLIKKGGKDVKKLISKYYSIVDKAVKRGIIHKNKSKRLKSSVAKLSKKK